MSHGTPLVKVFEAAAPRVEWAANTAISTPADLSANYSHRATDDALTAACGGLIAMNNAFAARIFSVLSMYNLTVSSGHNS